MAQIRRAEVTWEGDLMSGHGAVTSKTSNVLQQSPITWKSRAEEAAGKTSPEELLAAAHASCFSMALSMILAKGGHPPKRLRTSAAVTFDKAGDGFKVTSSALEVQGTVEGIDAATFQRAAEDAKENCPISAAIKGNVQLSVRATLS